MEKQLLIQISFVLDVRYDHHDKVFANIGRAYAYTLSLLGAQQVKVQVQSFPLPSQDPQHPKEGG